MPSYKFPVVEALWFLDYFHVYQFFCLCNPKLSWPSCCNSGLLFAPWLFCFRVCSALGAFFLIGPEFVWVLADCTLPFGWQRRVTNSFFTVVGLSSPFLSSSLLLSSCLSLPYFAVVAYDRSPHFEVKCSVWLALDSFIWLHL